VHWVPLSPISYKHSIEAVAKHRLKFWVSARARRSGQNLLSDHSSPRNAAQCEPSSPIATAILACLRKALEILQTYSVAGANKSPEPLLPYLQLIDQLAKAVMPIYKRAIMACPSIDEMVRPALLSNCVSFGRSPHKGLGAPTYSSYIASGLYINSKDDIEGTPVLSPLTLRVILRTNPRWTLAKSIRMLLDMDNVRWPDGFAYERFHARWECLWRELHRMHGKNEMSVLEFYGLAGTTSVFQDVCFQVAPKAVAQLSSDLTDEAAQADLEAAICLPKKPDQAGFDLATVETVTTVASKGKTVAGADPDDVQTKLLLCHECKWSLRDNPKSGLPQILNAKYENWKKQMAKWTSINDGANKVAHKRLIAVVFRTPSEHAPVRDKEDMLVVVRRQLEKLYSPTLASRPQFLVDYHPANQLQQTGPTGSPGSGSDPADDT